LYDSDFVIDLISEEGVSGQPSAVSRQPSAVSRQFEICILKNSCLYKVFILKRMQV